MPPKWSGDDPAGRRRVTFYPEDALLSSMAHNPDLPPPLEEELDFDLNSSMLRLQNPVCPTPADSKVLYLSVALSSGRVILGEQEFAGDDTVHDVMKRVQLVSGCPLRALIAPGPIVLKKSMELKSCGLFDYAVLTGVAVNLSGMYTLYLNDDHSLQRTQLELNSDGSFKYESITTASNKDSSSESLKKGQGAWTGTQNKFEVRLNFTTLVMEYKCRENTARLGQLPDNETEVIDVGRVTVLCTFTDSRPATIHFKAHLHRLFPEDKHLTRNEETEEENIRKEAHMDASDLATPLPIHIHGFLLARDQGQEANLPKGYVLGYGVIGHEATGITLRCPPLRIGPRREDSMVLYHYCPEDSFRLITSNKQLKFLRPSRGMRAHYGDGVYVTSKSPGEFDSKDDILKNNYTNKVCPLEQEQQISEWRDKGAVDYCIPLVVPSTWACNKSMGCNFHGDPMRDGRDIWVIAAFDDSIRDVVPIFEEDMTVYKRLKDADWSIRKDAVEMLRGAVLAGDPQAFEAARFCMGDDEPQVRIAAIWVIAEATFAKTMSAEVTDAEASQEIHKILLQDETNDVVRAAAMDAVAFLGIDVDVQA